MSVLNKLLRFPNLIIGLVTALFNMLNILNITHLSGDQVAGVNIFLGAVFALATALVTPANEVIAQQKSGEAVKATAKAEKAWGLTKDSVVNVSKAA